MIFQLIAASFTTVSAACIALQLLSASEQFVKRQVGPELDRLATLEVSEQKRDFAIAWFLAAQLGILFFLGWWVPPVAVLLIASSLFALRLLLKSWISRCERTLRSQILLAAEGMSNGSVLGEPIDKLLTTVSAQVDNPLQTIMNRIVRKVRDGIPVEQALREGARRTGLDTFTLFCSLAMMKHAAGGPSQQSWRRISLTISEMERVQQQVDADAAGGLLTVQFLSFMPLGYLALFAMAEPDAIGVLFNTWPGQITLAIVILIIEVAVWWCIKLLDIDA